ncbi:uncharacterized protein LOC134185598 isoform X2 [Corticium candelabrum]|uniref:uncharacterized protein LOC134185598 isoform X2 n=1 Tax=Corticium candelabrum TaxID=121492 RepID=UPI002E2526D6|nr:uncharacterized protein LOC134185598 isoform X2 [Corticium candelabrum]
MADENADIASGSESEWDDWEEDVVTSCQDLFSDQMFESVESMLVNCREVHGIDMSQFLSLHKLDFYSRIKFINYIRLERPSPGDVIADFDKLAWNDEKYLKPVLLDDPILQWDFGLENDDDSDDMELVENTGKTTTADSNDRDVVAAKMRDSEARALAAEESLSRAMLDLQQMRSTMQSVVKDKINVDKVKCRSNSNSSDNSEEDEYFASYSHFGIHKEMLQDDVRTGTYREFMLQTRHLFKDKVVLDVGCGTGILSMIAAQCGAKQVIGVDKSTIIHQAVDIVMENGLHDVVTLIRGRIEDVQLPTEKVDIIVSEWMGYFLLFESMLDSVIFARDKWLSHTGSVYPDVCHISLAAVSNQTLWESNIAFWDDVYGFKMSCLKELSITEPLVTAINPESVVSDSVVVKTIDVKSVVVTDLDFEADFVLRVTRNCVCTAIVGYFNVQFNGDVQLSFSTHPSAKATHWKQTVFLLQEPIHVKEGDTLSGTICCEKSKKDRRALSVSLNVINPAGQQSRKYCMS